MNSELYNETYLDKYVDLVIRKGVNIQKGQELLINSPVDCAFFVRKAVKAAYDAGASNVHIRWNDDACRRSFYLMADDAVFDSLPEWDSLMMNTLTGRGCALLSVSASDPEALKGVDSGRISRFQRASQKELKPTNERLLSNTVRWSVVSIPTEAWAKKAFPDIASTGEAMERMWREIFAACRVDEGDPVQNWDKHIVEMNKNLKILNDHAFKTLRLRNAAGTDLTVEMPENHVWLGGQEIARDNIPFLANIPTEEVFSAPRRDGVNGTVVGTMPSVYHGDIIDDFSITFKDGKVVSYRAGKGEVLLKSLVSDVPNMDRLGEIALVPHNSPISNASVLFYNTLFDENASCHLALGSAYFDCVKGGSDMSEAEREKAGINVCDSHHDFMFGSADMEITGITADGEEIPIFRNGNFAF